MTLNIPVERVAEQARGYDPARFFLLCLAALPLALGWTARAVWFVASFAVAAVRVGWESGPAGASDERGRGARR
ncbi:hypothetical protein ACFYY8_33635 [Streptosporangium sp. NPDC001559]|uniref:hypothetical protein n=1 Tax=unclassified Streptosporangium TaxID=2632669 RepID=UPI00332EBA07